MQKNKQQPLSACELLANHPELNLEVGQYNINVTANFGAEQTKDAVLDAFRAYSGANKAISLYFHVPLCDYICHFCSYVKKALPKNGKETDTLQLWTDLLIKESRMYLKLAPSISEAVVESVYFGGGTAALLRPHQLIQFQTHLSRDYCLAPECEITLEGNPDNFLVDGYLEAAMESGFNRFSVGIQSLQDQVTQFTGRGHNRADSLRAVELLQATGRPFNVDLMVGLPFQTPTNVACDVQMLAGAGVPTITLYRLRNADRQKMGIGNRAVWHNPRAFEKVIGLLPSVAQTYRQRDAATSVLRDNGYEPSPCGWWNRPGAYPHGIPQVSRNKWQRYDSLLAYGPGAYGWLAGVESVLQRHNITDIAQYARCLSVDTDFPIASGRFLSGNQAVAVELGFAFKAFKPISLRQLGAKHGMDLLRDAPFCGVVEKLVTGGFAELDMARGVLTPTLRGEALHEELISVYIHGAVS